MFRQVRDTVSMLRPPAARASTQQRDENWRHGSGRSMWTSSLRSLAWTSRGSASSEASPWTPRPRMASPPRGRRFVARRAIAERSGKAAQIPVWKPWPRPSRLSGPGQQMQALRSGRIRGSTSIETRVTRADSDLTAVLVVHQSGMATLAMELFAKRTVTWPHIRGQADSGQELQLLANTVVQWVAPLHPSLGPVQPRRTRRTQPHMRSPTAKRLVT
mmetsp:Transcript_13615/g.30013  ORF Transcript_13615/g.30013 Transcript_13615/m.30013 type:complete len:217 (-) Transcript_13615:2715-3365(-)